MINTGRKNKIRYGAGAMAFDSINILIMILIMIVMILPILHVVSVSFSSAQETNKGGFFLYPRDVTLKAYESVFANPIIWTSYLNTIIYAFGGAAFTLVITALTAYPLSIPGFRLKKFVTIYILITMFIGGGMVPTYLTMRKLSLINTVWVMIIPFCVSAYNVILFRTFFMGIPAELRESAYLDGAGEIRILFKIIIPLSKAIFATIALFTIVGKWNDWFSALIYLNSSDKYPLQMILRNILNNARIFEEDPIARSMIRQNEITTMNIKMAVIVVTLFPIMTIYPFMQKYFVKGVMIGTIKG